MPKIKHLITIVTILIITLFLISCSVETNDSKNSEAKKNFQQEQKNKFNQNQESNKADTTQASSDDSSTTDNENNDDSTTTQAKPKVTFIINTHEWYYIEEGSQTITRLLDLFEERNLRAEFYMTAPTFKAYEDKYPEVLERMQDLDMSISFHLREPHPLKLLKQNSDLTTMSHDELVEELTNYESYELDLTTGEYNEDIQGGYSYMAQQLGYAPPAVGANSNNLDYQTAELEVLSNLGAQMYVAEHSGSTLTQGTNGMLTRPSQFTVGRLIGISEEKKATGLDHGDFWWNYNEAVVPEELFNKADSGEHGVVIIHDSDFYALKAGWRQIYYDFQEDGSTKGLPSPYDLTRTDDEFQFYPEDHLEQTWENYEAILDYATENMEIITSKDIIEEYYASN